MCCSMQSGTSLWASGSSLPPPLVSETTWFAPFSCICVVVAGPGTAASPTRIPNNPILQDKMTSPRLISATVISQRASKRSCFRLWGVFLRCPHSDVTVPTVSNPTRKREKIWPAHHICAQSRFCKAVVHAKAGSVLSSGVRPWPCSGWCEGFFFSKDFFAAGFWNWDTPARCPSGSGVVSRALPGAPSQGSGVCDADGPDGSSFQADAFVGSEVEASCCKSSWSLVLSVWVGPLWLLLQLLLLSSRVFSGWVGL